MFIGIGIIIGSSNVQPEAIEWLDRYVVAALYAIYHQLIKSITRALREIIYDVGGGVPGGKRFKAVQTGGPSGGASRKNTWTSKSILTNWPKSGRSWAPAA